MAMLAGIAYPLLIAMVPNSPATARMEPTERSMPPLTITSVMPSAMMLITAVCRATLARFMEVRKWGVAIVSATKRKIRVTNGRSRWRRWIMRWGRECFRRSARLVA